MKKFSPDFFFDLNHYQHAALFLNCLYAWEGLAKIEGYLKNASLGKIEVPIPNGAFLVNPEKISIGKGSVIEPGAYIKGPCLIGENCSIRHGAYIRGNFIAGNDCVIGHDTEIKNAIFLNGTKAGHFAYVADSILGNSVNLGAGTKIANLKLDHSEIKIFAEDLVISSGLRKFGAIIGDDSQMGCNCVTNPGALLGKNVFCYPCINFGGYIPSNHTVKAQTHPLILPR